MKKRLIYLLLSLALTSCGGESESVEPMPEYDYYGDRIYTSVRLNSGNAKFFKDKIITSSESQKLTILNKDATILKKFDNTNISWLNGYEEENLIVYGNFDNHIGIIKLNDSYECISNDIILESQNVQIHPSINKINDTYYLTATEIIGTINNSDSKKENGEYIVHLYSSTDLANWSFVSDVVDCKNNIEDVGFSIFGNTFYITYEKEDLDKGNSSVQLKTSNDFGRSWSEPIELLPETADQEPASFKQCNAGFILYYSSDKANKGKSYNGAKAYYALYDTDMNLIEKDRPFSTAAKKGILLYDAKFMDNELYLLYAKNFSTSNDLVVETMKKAD